MKVSFKQETPAMQLTSIIQAIEGWLMVDTSMSPECRRNLQTQVNALKALRPHIERTHWTSEPISFEVL